MGQLNSGLITIKSIDICSDMQTIFVTNKLMLAAYTYARIWNQTVFNIQYMYVVHQCMHIIYSTCM